MNKFTKLGLFTLLLATVVFSSCKKDYETIESVDDAAIQSYLKQNNLTFTKDTGKEYYYKINTPGTGNVLINQDSVFYSYTFKTLSGQVLNQTSNVMIPGTFLGYTDRFTINNISYLFTPIREVLTKLKRGGTATLIMPSHLAFGKNGVSTLNIGSNENILVDVGIYAQEKIHEIDELEINNFLAANSLTAIKDPSRVRYIVTQQGTGDQVLPSSTLSVNYTGRLLSGYEFNPASTAPVSFVLAETIKGWSILKNFKAGTKLRLFIPSDLGYGQGGTTGIPPNAVLDFDIEIVSVTN